MLEVADIFREAGPAYRQRFAARMLPSHLKAMRDIERCRTPALGGHLRQCTDCRAYQYSYHSCRNRHCPKCHKDRTLRWLERQRARFLPCPYFLLTFTLPAQLRHLARTHQKNLYSILIIAAGQAVLTLANDPRYLGARPGIIAVLHTWTRPLLFHPHAHLLVTGGGLTADAQAWRFPRYPRFLFPARVLSVLFRAKLRDALKQAGLIHLVPRKAWRKPWVVHARHAGSGHQVLDYLGRYLFRVAIANSRIDAFQDGYVSFRYRDNTAGKLQHCRLPAQEFIRRFLQHVLPRGFAKVRYYGLYSSACRLLHEQARSLLLRHQESIPSNHHAPVDHHAVNPGEPTEPICPYCHQGVMKIVRPLPPTPAFQYRSRDPP